MIKPIKLVNEIIAKTGTTVEKQIKKNNQYRDKSY